MRHFYMQTCRSLCWSGFDIHLKWCLVTTDGSHDWQKMVAWQISIDFKTCSSCELQCKILNVKKKLKRFQNSQNDKWMIMHISQVLSCYKVITDPTDLPYSGLTWHLLRLHWWASPLKSAILLVFIYHIPIHLSPRLLCLHKPSFSFTGNTFMCQVCSQQVVLIPCFENSRSRQRSTGPPGCCWVGCSTRHTAWPWTARPAPPHHFLGLLLSNTT